MIKIMNNVIKIMNNDRGKGGRYSFLLGSITDVKLNLDNGDYILHIYTRKNVNYNFIVHSEKNYQFWQQVLQ